MSCVEIARHDAVAVVTLSGHERGNLLSLEMFRAPSKAAAPARPLRQQPFCDLASRLGGSIAGR